MIRIVSWNIAKRQAPWRELVAMDADIALVQEGGQPSEESGQGVGRNCTVTHYQCDDHLGDQSHGHD